MAKKQDEGVSFDLGEDLQNMPSQSSLQLVSEVNNFLDEIDNTSKYLSENESRILEYVRQMKVFGFNAPFSSLVSSTGQELDDAGELEKTDQKKQNYYMRYYAGLKKMSLNRARVALSSHKAYRLAIERQGAPGWIKNLPLGGNYIRRLFEAGDIAILNYREYMDSFSSRSARLSMALVTVEHEVEGFKKTSKFRIANVENLEQKVVRAYGVGAKVIKTESAKALFPIIKNKSSRVAIFTAVAAYSLNHAKAQVSSEHPPGKRILEYAAILKKHGIITDAILDNVEKYDDVKKQLVKAGFATFEDDTFKTDPEIVSFAKSTRSKSFKYSRSGMADYILSPLAKFYSLKSRSSRESNGIFPSLVSTPALSQISVLELMEFAYPSTAGLSQAIWEKIDAEDGFPPNVGADYYVGFISSKNTVSVEGLAQALSMTLEQVKKSIELFNGLSSGRGGKFLSELGGAKK